MNVSPARRKPDTIYIGADMKHDLAIEVKGEPFAMLSINPNDLKPMVIALQVCSKHHYDSKCRALTDKADSAKGFINGIVTQLDNAVSFALDQGDEKVERVLKFRDVDILMKSIEMRYTLHRARLLTTDQLAALADFVWICNNIIRMMNEYAEPKRTITLHAPILKDENAKQ